MLLGNCLPLARGLTDLGCKSGSCALGSFANHAVLGVSNDCVAIFLCHYRSGLKQGGRHDDGTENGAHWNASLAMIDLEMILKAVGPSNKNTKPNVN
ncbi:MAG: hypothetical protein ACO1NN_12700 [Sphingopyxis sp.]